MAYTLKAIKEMYNRVLDIVRAEFTDLPPESAGANAVEGLQTQYDIIVQKDADKSSFSGTAQKGSAIRAVARRNLYDYQMTLSNTSKIIARKKTGFDENFPSPSTMNDDQLLSAVRASSAKAVEHKTDFIAQALTQEFLESGAGFITDFDNSLDITNEASGSRGAAVGAKNAAYEKAGEHFDVLDNFIRNFYREDAAKLNAWKIASRIERSPKKKKGEG